MKVQGALIRSSSEKWAIEIKRKSNPGLSRGFHTACADVKPQRKYIVYSGNDIFPLGNDIATISLHDMMQKLLKKR